MDQDEKIVSQLIAFLRTSGKIELLPGIIQKLKNELDRIRGENTALVTSASPLSTKELEQLQKQLLTLFGKHLEIINHVDPELIGGFVIQVSDKIIDLSVQNYLNDLERKFQ
jgi:ATP synthase F1 delta subunit